jgi:Uma2 family endonuclease
LQLADANNFVEMKMEIVGYNDPGKKKKAMRLQLVDGLPSLMNVQHKARSFESLTDLGDYLRQNVKVSFPFAASRYFIFHNESELESGKPRRDYKNTL